MSEMNWSHRLQDVVAYEQGFLVGDESDEMEVHLQFCKDCRYSLEGVQRVLPGMYPPGLSMLMRQPPGDVYSAIMRSLR